jgi:hypothetical protein
MNIHSMVLEVLYMEWKTQMAKLTVVLSENLHCKYDVKTKEKNGTSLYTNK